MSAKLEDLLPAAAQSVGGRSPRAPRELLDRLQLLAGLLREAPPATSGPRLLWRDERGEVRALAVDRLLVLGRDPACDLVLASPRISRRHCRIAPAGDGGEIEDLGSSNGTRINGESLAAHRPRALHDGDLIEIGGVPLAVSLGAR